MAVQYNQLGDSDLKVSNICLGTMTFGQQNSKQEAHQQLDYAFDQGINFIDTAEMYPVPPRAETAYSAENIVGSWIAKNPRNRITIKDPIGSYNITNADIPKNTIVSFISKIELFKI